MALTPFDDRIVFHTREALIERWPFVPVAQQRDYRATYRPVGLLDSFEFPRVARLGVGAAEASDGAQRTMRRGRRTPRSRSIAVSRATRRNSPSRGSCWVEALMKAHADSEASVVLQRALCAIRPLPGAAFAAGHAGASAARRGRGDSAARARGRRVRLARRRCTSCLIAYALTHDAERARMAALRVAQLAPNYPGLADWLAIVGRRSIDELDARRAPGPE